MPGSESSPFSPKGIDIADIIHYRAKGLSTSEIGRLTGCDHSNVVRRLQSVNAETLQNFNTYKGRVFEYKQHELLKTLTGDKINEMSGLQLITGAAILEDKIRAIRGQATEIIEHRSVQVDLNKAYEQIKSCKTNDNNSHIEAEITSIPEIPIKIDNDNNELEAKR